MEDTIKITELNDPRLDAYFRLTEGRLRNKLEPEKGIFIAESETVIDVALQAGCIPDSFLCDRAMYGARAQALAARCRAVHPGMPVYLAREDLLRQTTGFALTRGMLAEMKRPERKSARQILHGARRVAVLEDVADAMNVGAVLRSAAALGIDAVLLTPSCCDPLLRRSVRVSMGTALLVPWAYLPEREDPVDFLHGTGFVCAAMALREDSVPPDDEALMREEKLAILLGTEGRGLKPETIARSDYVVTIPMQNGVDSLNVAAASAVAFWQLRVRNAECAKEGPREER